MLLIALMQLTIIINEVGLNKGFKFKLHMCLFKCQLCKLPCTATLGCSNMHANAINRFLEFFRYFFIYNLSYLELQLNFYDFWKFSGFSENK